MQRARRSNLSPQLDMTPLIDTVFLLLTFFVFSLALSARYRLTEINLSPAAAGREPTAAGPVIIELNAAGAIIIDNRIIPPSDLPQALQSLEQQNPQAAVYIAADRAAATGDLFQLMDTLAAAKIPLRFLREPGDKAAKPQNRKTAN